MKTNSATLAFLISSPVLAAPLIRSIPTIVTNKPTTLITTSSKPTATMLVEYGAAHYAPQGAHKRPLPPSGREVADRLSLVNRDCSAFTDEDRAWIAEHPELSPVLEQCESWELYQPNTPEEDHVGACNEGSIGCKHRRSLQERELVPYPDINPFYDDIGPFILPTPGPQTGFEEELVVARKHIGELYDEKKDKEKKDKE
ncbi:uncharacterized protein N0V89_009525 [Didymosphaeria variabile]|uniref:Uncharacterized protein n=1 Tax=Didymosphaeria variabile TaxID=1932322 RepID=A0A9W8XDI9_9PLEO|nr:uncharacterized protein N0V89_009525 [Didymosphaeria variabile]KAJ4348153.1 hypothetical protein N0V89_009525 [Didymosphaeria variabile]